MKASFRAEDPEDVVMSLELSMTLRDWRKLRDQLGTDYQSFQLARIIRELISKAQQGFTSTDEIDQ